MSRYLTNLDLSLVNKQQGRDPEMKFPCKLYRMLMETESQGLTHIVSWHKEGLCFRVHDQKAFVDEILPKYFKKSKYRSFQRQCNLYGFHRITAVKPFWDSCYYHPTFVKGDDDCCKNITRSLRSKNAATKKKAPKETLYPLPSLTMSVTSNRDSVDTEVISENLIPAHISSGDTNTNESFSSIHVDNANPNRNVEEKPKQLSMAGGIGEKRLLESITDGKGEGMTMNRRSSFQELCHYILGDDCPLCEDDNGDLLLKNIIMV